ncbi:2Fe-2S iron-sulfur cluster-binding protein [Streptomyces sp. NPDC058877]|uniref:2Fe-2S iron-sulfur cluster-binding protein n=1 Tax=unclassified Streptomyces TaxID=2593676 RepID=UPI0036B8B862
MSNNDQQQNPGGWEPIPQSEGYDGDATAFVQLPPDFMLDGVPLEAPGHGYVPPMITPLQPLNPPADPAATGSWTVHTPTEAQQTPYYEGSPYGDQSGAYAGDYHPDVSYQDGSYPDGSHPGGSAHDGSYPDGSYPDGPFQGAERFQPPAYVEQAVEHVEHDPNATAEWRFEEVAPAAEPGATGQWQIPAVPEEPPAHAGAGATLPGGAPAPWALPEEPAAEAPEVPEAAEVPEASEPLEAPEVPEAPEASGDFGPAEPNVEEPPELTDPAVPEPVADEESPATPDDPSTPDAPVVSAAPAGPEAPVVSETPVVSEAPVLPAAPVVVEAPGTPGEVVPEPAAAVDASTDSDEHPHVSYTLRVNGTDRPVTGSWIGESLLYVLRERLGLAGAKDGCSQGECGACTVQVDGRLVASCLVPAATTAGSEVRTVEGLATDGEPSDVQRAMARCGTVQCGFCIPGMCMTVHDLLEGNHAPTELETRQALAGNLCRCSGYRGVLQAVRDVVAEREATATATAPENTDAPRVPQQIPHPHDGGMA